MRSFRTDEPEDYPHKKRESSPGGVIPDGWFRKSILHIPGLKLNPQRLQRSIRYPIRR